MAPLILADLSLGRNGMDSPVSPLFPDNQCVEALNVDFRNGGLGRKRGGMYDVLGNTTGSGLTTEVFSLFRHTPSGDETLGEMWAVDNVNPVFPNRLPAGTAWSAPNTMTDGIDDNFQNVNFVSFNGKLFFFYNGSVDRLNVYDPNVPTRIRTVGLTAPAAPTVANTGAGAYAATIRYYRTRYVDITSAIARCSEPSPSVSFTPSGAGTAARVTKPAALTLEGETHWRVEASPDNVNFYIVAYVVVGTTTYDDSAAVSSYSSLELSEILGTYTLPTSAKYGVTDGNRLIMVGNWESGKGSRVAWTPVLGSLNRGDDERLFQTATLKPYLDLDDKNGGDATGIGQINGVVYVFKYRQIWRLAPTGDIDTPYIARRISGTVGTVSHKSIALGEDSVGNPCLYFMSHKGPYRVGGNGVEYLGRDIEDLTRTAAGAPNVNTVATRVVAHSVFHADLSQWWLWYATGTNNSPNECNMLDVKNAVRRDQYGVRGGWSRFTGPVATAICSAMGNYKLGATASLRPWVGLADSSGHTPIIGICDQDTIQTDRGTAFQAYVKTKSLGDPQHFGTQMIHMRESRMIGRVNNLTVPYDVSIQLTAIRDFGLESPVSTAHLTDTSGSILKFEDSYLADALVLQIQIGDSAAAANQWQIDELQLTLQEGGEA